jgi:Ni,Fe-hydrogenase III large subunit
MFSRGSEVRILRTDGGPGVDSIADLVPAADWDEREARDLYGVRFAGRETSRALVDHEAELGSWTVPVAGADANQVAVGPIHAGVIESGHFRFHVVGERILLVDLRLFYKHRGLEAAAAGTELERALGHAGQACGACAVTNSIAYAQAVEALQGLAPSRALRRARTTLLELERIYNHLHDIAAICAGVGFAPGNMAFAALKERALRLNAAIAGHRFLFGAVAVGRSEIELAGAQLREVRSGLRELHSDAASCWRELTFATSLQARAEEVGILTGADAERLGTVGPAARASGVRIDTRAVSPALWYGSELAPATLEEPAGDVGARLRIRAAELEQSLELVDELFAEPLESGPAGWGGDPAPLGVARVESPRGETVCAVEADAGRVRRLHLRTGSYANWPSLAEATIGEMLPDFPLINKSFELCYACADR